MVDILMVDGVIHQLITGGYHIAWLWIKTLVLMDVHTNILLRFMDIHPEKPMALYESRMCS